jgi:heme-degrading monooxygenase HmoA
MAITNKPLPDVTRPDADIVLVGEWTVATPERQRAAVDAAMAAWEDLLWPEGLFAHHGFVGVDGTSVLHYIQWTGEEAIRAFQQTTRPAWARRVDEAVPGIERQGVTGYQLYRSANGEASEQIPGCIVAVMHAFDGPDIERARQFIDARITGVDDEPMPGFIAAHFHISTDGGRMLNYAEWVSEQAHATWATGGAQILAAERSPVPA